MKEMNLKIFYLLMNIFFVTGNTSGLVSWTSYEDNSCTTVSTQKPFVTYPSSTGCFGFNNTSIQLFSFDSLTYHGNVFNTNNLCQGNPDYWNVNIFCGGDCQISGINFKSHFTCLYTNITTNSTIFFQLFSDSSCKSEINNGSYFVPGSNGTCFQTSSNTSVIFLQYDHYNPDKPLAQMILYKNSSNCQGGDPTQLQLGFYFCEGTCISTTFGTSFKCLFTFSKYIIMSSWILLLFSLFIIF